ncbi:MAG TPA: peptidoglycan DD-metalloendopeptidase family protein [Anaerovoracaceae bacterium]|nr:peptidoglycan DD-metalloendopeptidase family protein [Anaerovoracaceae bacterium]
MPNKNYPRYLCRLLILVFIAMSAAPSFAYTAYEQAFQKNFPGTYTDWRSPLSNYPVVTSKWNTPRASGTSPHIGVDLSAAAGTTLYAVESGTLGPMVKDGFNTTVLTIDPSLASDLACHYVHVRSMSARAYYYKGAPIGQSGSVGTNSAHLHFGAHSTSGLSYRTEILYRWLPNGNWNAGKDLDTYSNVQWNGGKTAQITAYYKTGSSPYNPQAPAEVVIFHRLKGGSTWEGGVAMTRGSNYTYTYSFSGKKYKNVAYKSGDTIQWMVRIKRSGINNVYTFFPAKYYQPGRNPNATSYRYDFQENTYQ